MFKTLGMQLKLRQGLEISKSTKNRQLRNVVFKNAAALQKARQNHARLSRGVAHAGYEFPRKTNAEYKNAVLHAKAVSGEGSRVFLRGHSPNAARLVEVTDAGHPFVTARDAKKREEKKRKADRGGGGGGGRGAKAARTTARRGSPR